MTSDSRAQTGARIMVSKGLTGGETLVLGPGEKLRDGGKVVEKTAAAK